MQLFYQDTRYELKKVADVVHVYKNTTFGWTKVDTCQSNYVAEQRIRKGMYKKY